MAPKPIRVIRGVGSELTLRQLEEASAKLLVARIRNEEPQVSYTFIQRLLDEVIRRRREEIAEEEDLLRLIADIADEDDEDYADESDLEEIVDLVNLDLGRVSLDAEDDEPLVVPEEWIEPDVFDLETLEFTDLDLAREPDPDEFEEDDEDELEFVEPPRPPSRGQIQLSSKRHNRWSSTINFWRILVIVFFAACVMVCGVAISGCNHHNKRYAITPEPGDDVVGPLIIKYRDIDQKKIDPPEERRKRIRRSVELALDWFRSDWKKIPFVAECQVFMGDTPEDYPTYVPCGVPNGGGCITFADRVIKISSSECDSAKYLYHELNHARLLDLGVTALSNARHEDPSWALVTKRTKEIEAFLCAEYKLNSTTTK